MKVVTSEEMRSIDRRTIKGYGLPGLVLMERAGLAVARGVMELGKNKILVLSGSGNNGGDGLVAARNLHNAGFNVKVLLTAGKDRLGPDCLIQYKIAEKMGVPLEFRARVKPLDLHGAAVIDALFGTGLKKAVTGQLAVSLELLNESDVPVVSVDIPSGVSADTGEIMGAAVKADVTVTFGLPKRGHLLFPGADYTGKLHIADIGFPPELTTDERLRCNLIEGRDISPFLPKRRHYSHKGDYGHVLLIAGSRGKTGAALMAAGACLKAGAGLVTIGVPEYLTGSFQSRVTEEMLLPLPDSGEGALSIKSLDRILAFIDKNADVLAIGPGVGTSRDTANLVRELVLRCTAPMVVDADAINAIGSGTDIFDKVKAPVILTPHPGEFSRLAKLNVPAIEKNRIEAASGFSEKTGTYVVLKGVPTVIAEPGGSVYLNSTGNPGMAKAGTGDVLTGVVAAFLAQGLSPIEASIAGVYLHGLAGDMAASKTGEHSLLASDVIGALPGALREVCDPNYPCEKIGSCDG